MAGATFKLADAFVALGVVVSDGEMTADGSNPYLLDSATAVFKQSDVNKKIVVEGAGAAGADLTTTIVRRISATQVELALPALTTVTGSDISYALGRYRLSDVIKEDVDGNDYELIALRRLQFQVVGPGKVFIGGPYVSPTNRGVELNPSEIDNTTPGDRGIVTTSDYLCTDTADTLINILWSDDLNLHTPA